MAGSSTLGRQFRATQTWNILVLHLKENAAIKKRRNLKKIDECFTGANAVDVLHHFVRKCPEQFKNATSISRENIVRLCQSFLDMSIVCRIMENDVDKLDKFEDSTTALYAFIDDDDDGDSNTTSNGRQVLREIDGDIRNSLGHISISNQNKGFITKHSSLSLRTKRRPHFPTFSGVTSHSSKESINQTDDDDSDMKIQHPLKRTSTLVRRVVKRSSSDPNLQKSIHESSISSENQEFKKKNSGTRSSVRLRFSQRLSFRKKSFSLDTSSYSEDNAFDEGTKYNQLEDKACNSDPPVFEELNKNDHKRRSLHDMTAKAARGFHSMISTPNLFNKMMHQSQTYKVNDTLIETEQCSSACFDNSSKRTVHDIYTSDDDECTSPIKTAKKEFIKETPIRMKNFRQSNYMKPFTNFANNISIKRRSLRKSERSRKNEQSCVLANPLAKESCENVEPANDDKRILTAEELCRVQKECVRVRLLQKLDMPFVDDVITSPITSDCISKKQFANNLANQFDSINEDLYSCYNRDDSWLSAALTVLTHAPNSHELLAKIAKQENECNKKIQLYFAIYDYYKSQSSTVFPSSMVSIMSEVVHILGTKPINESLEVVQLFVHLLPNEKIRELQDLVTFLHYVVKSDDVVISSRCSNKMLILQTFPGLLFSTLDKLTPCDVTSGPAGLLQFLLENYALAFTLPAAVSVAVERKRQLIENNQIDSPSLIRDSTCSQMLSLEEFEAQKVEFTQNQIAELAKFVAADTSVLPSRKKKDFLKKLQASHPSAYATLRQPLKASHQLFASSVESSKKILKVSGTGALTRRRSKK